VVLATLFVTLELASGGWFWFYCVKLPAAHGLDPRSISAFFVADVPKTPLFVLGTALVLAPFVASFARRRRAPEQASWRETAFAFVLAAGVASAFALRAHRGGWANVIVVWTTLGCVAVAVVATRAEALAGEALADGALARGVPAAALVLAIVQLLGGTFDPTETAPNADDYRDAQRFRAFVRALEARGEVVVAPEGGVTAKTHAHTAALYDVLRAGGRAPADYLRGISERRYVAIVTSAPIELDCDYPGCVELTELTMRNYFIAAERSTTPGGTTGSTMTPRWILRPRARPLDGLSRAELDARQAEEIGLAERRASARPRGADAVPDDAIEQLAAAAAAATGARPR
jgi:hypothetical protein